MSCLKAVLGSHGLAPTYFDGECLLGPLNYSLPSIALQRIKAMVLHHAIRIVSYPIGVTKRIQRG